MGNVNINRRPRWWDKTHSDVDRAMRALRAANNLAWAREHGPKIVACIRRKHPEWLAYANVPPNPYADRTPRINRARQSNV